MSLTTRVILIGGAALLLILLVSLGGSDSSGGSMTDDAYAGGTAGSARPGGPDEVPGGGTRVALVDQGLQMEIGQFAVPEGWEVVQDLATDPATGQSARHTLDFRGPNGELIRSLGTAPYGQMAGTGFDGAWQQAVMGGLQGDVEDLQMGAPQRSQAVEASPAYQRLAPRVAPYGIRLEGLEVPLRGRRSGQPVEGLVYLIRSSSDQLPDAGMVQVSAIVSPPERLAETQRTEQQIAASFQPNPQHQQRMEQLGQTASQQSAARHEATMGTIQGNTRAMQQGHEQRMADSRAQFDAHQQRMQGRWDAADQQMQGWQAGQASSDEMQRRRINGINGTADVYDAQSGQTYRGVQDGSGAYWADPTTGTVVGTDAYSGNPDAYRYNETTNLDDM